MNNTALTTNPPESFFETLSETKQSGFVYVHDPRLPSFKTLPNGKSQWIARYAKPSKLAVELSQNYPLGSCIASIDIIQRQNGQLLTIIRKSATEDGNGFKFDFWAGLTTI